MEIILFWKEKDSILEPCFHNRYFRFEILCWKTACKIEWFLWYILGIVSWKVNFTNIDQDFAICETCDKNSTLVCLLFLFFSIYIIAIIIFYTNIFFIMAIFLKWKHSWIFNKNLRLILDSIEIKYFYKTFLISFNAL